MRGSAGAAWLHGVKAALLTAVLAMAGTAHADPALDAIAAATPGCPTRTHCVGLAVHVAVTDTGPVADATWVSAQLAAANRQFEKLDLGYKIVSIDALPAARARIANRRERDALGTQVKGTVIHVFLTGRLDDIDKDGEQIYGVTWRTKSDTKFVIVSTLAWERTLAHELGHVFGLPHSEYAVSIMNKTERTDPPMDQRRFADQEIALMKPRIAWMFRSKALTDAN